MIEARSVPQIVDLDRKDIDALLSRINFGHLGVCGKGQPYVVPIHFAYGSPGIYFFTTEGKKTDIIDKNPNVCLQLEDVRNREDWESVIVTGTAERLKTPEQIDRAMKLIKKINPKLSPAWSIRWLDDWVRSNVEVVYSISADNISGRRAFLQAGVL